MKRTTIHTRILHRAAAVSAAAVLAAGGLFGGTAAAAEPEGGSGSAPAAAAEPTASVLAEGATTQAESRIWCRYRVDTGPHDALNVRAQPAPGSALRYRLFDGDVVLAEPDSLTNGYLNLNRSLGHSQWGHADLLVYLGPGDSGCPLP